MMFAAALTLALARLSVAEDVAPPAPAPAATESVSPAPAEVLVTVNGQAITRGDLDRELDAAMARFAGRASPEQIAQQKQRLEKEALEAMVTKRLLNDAIAAEKIDVTDSEVEAAIQQILAQHQLGKTLAEFLAATGLAEDKFRADVRQGLQLDKLFKSRVDAVPPAADEEIGQFYTAHPEQFQAPETARARHILIAVAATDTPEQKAEKKARIEALRERILKGEDFAKLASENSDCPSKANGGDLGTFDRSRMVPPFADAAFSQPIGEVGGVVETQFGYHLINVTERQPARTVPLDEVKDRLGQFLRAQKQREAVQTYVAGLKAAAKIVYPNAAP